MIKNFLIYFIILKMFMFIFIIFVGILLFSYGIHLLSNLKDEDGYKNAKRFGYSIIITLGVILIGIGGMRIVFYNRFNAIRTVPTLPQLPRFSPFSSPVYSPVNQTSNI